MTTRMERRGVKGGPRSVKHALKSRPTPIKIAMVAAVVMVLALAGVGYALVRIQSEGLSGKRAGTGKQSPLPHASIVATDGANASATVDASGSVLSSAGVEVEVPDVVGNPVEEAEIVLQSVGFRVRTRVADRAVGDLDPGTVVAMSPPARTRLKPGASVTVTYNPRATAATQASNGVAGRVVCIDAGHQQTPDLSLEPVGPGSSEMKAKVAGGASGVVAGPEYARTLEVSLKLREKLQAAGVNVVMVRTANDVNVANSERARIGNRAGAALTVRVHFDSSSNQSVRGISTLYPSGNAWCAPIEPASKRAATLVQDAVCAATGARRRGIFGRSDMTGFNWSTVPTIIVENGFLSNPDDDRLAASSAYQDKLAQGIADGVLAYLVQ